MPVAISASSSICLTRLLFGIIKGTSTERFEGAGKYQKTNPGAVETPITQFKG
jgi:hypothetical protein